MTSKSPAWAQKLVILCDTVKENVKDEWNVTDGQGKGVPDKKPRICLLGAILEQSAFCCKSSDFDGANDCNEELSDHQTGLNICKCLQTFALVELNIT